MELHCQIEVKGIVVDTNEEPLIGVFILLKDTSSGTVTDLEGKFAKLESMGLRVTETRVAGGADFTFIEQAFVDPDGHLVVCYEVLPDNSP